MRLLHWLAAVVCMFSMTAGVRGVMAQEYPGPISMPAGGAVPVQNGWAPGLERVSYPEMITGNAIPHYSAVLSGAGGQGAAPPGMLPYPQISPFEHRFSEHSVRNGLWFHETNDSPRRYYGGLAAMHLRPRKPEEALFGNPAFVSASAFLIDPITIGVARGDFHVFDKHFKTEGVRVHWGFIDADDTGIEVTAWWASDVTQQFKLGQDVDAGDPNAGIIDAPSIPVANGGAGDALVFDRLFRMRYTQEAVNIHADRLFAPWWNRNAIKIRPVGGIRYMFLRERFAFDGIAGGPPFFTGFLSTNIRSHMVGPQFGLQAEIGGKALRIVAVSRVIVFANIEKLRMEGDNFGSPAQVNLGGVNSFTQTITTSHLSPAFEQTVHVEARVMQFIPLLNRVTVLKNAMFRGGFTFFNVAEVARPGRSVRYRGLPQRPELIVDRSKWSFVSWDLGLLFEY